MTEKEILVIHTRCTTLERAYYSYRSIYTTKYLSKNLKLKHYNSTVIPSGLHTSERALINRKGPLTKLELKEKILRKILVSIRQEEGTYRSKHNDALYEHQDDIFTSMRKRRLPSTDNWPPQPLQTHQQDSHGGRWREGFQDQVDHLSKVRPRATRDPTRDHTVPIAVPTGQGFYVGSSHCSLPARTAQGPLDPNGRRRESILGQEEAQRLSQE